MILKASFYIVRAPGAGLALSLRHLPHNNRGQGIMDCSGFGLSQGLEFLELA